MSEAARQGRKEGPAWGGAASRVGALLSSVMDLHVRIALQEVDQEKRRLISGALLLSCGLTLVLLALVVAEVALVLWLHGELGWSWIHSCLGTAALNLVLSGVALRLGGQLLKGPYLPNTLAGLGRTTRALLGRQRMS
ncbi:MAG: phage holin family protein [Synechococcus sp.]|nr:phage holin family protein [Synechococcus sp.]